MSDDSEEEDEEAALQEQEVMASPDVEPVAELEEDRQEAETEPEEEDRESDKIEEREDEMTSEGNKPSWRNPPRKDGRLGASARKKTRTRGTRRPRMISKKR